MTTESLSDEVEREEKAKKFRTSGVGSALDGHQVSPREAAAAAAKAGLKAAP